ncbi:MAG: hypothetical protein AB4062_02315 [Crocosphaera sp.]
MPTEKQAITCLEICHRLSNLLQPIYVFRYDIAFLTLANHQMTQKQVAVSLSGEDSQKALLIYCNTEIKNTSSIWNRN